MQFHRSNGGGGGSVVWWQQLIVIVTLVMLNVTKVFGDSDVVQKPYHSDSQSELNPDGKKTTYEEFFIEHNVSQKDAIKSFREIGPKLMSSSEFVLVIFARSLGYELTCNFDFFFVIIFV